MKEATRETFLGSGIFALLQIHTHGFAALGWTALGLVLSYIVHELAGHGLAAKLEGQRPVFDWRRPYQIAVPQETFFNVAAGPVTGILGGLALAGLALTSQRPELGLMAMTLLITNVTALVPTQGSDGHKLYQQRQPFLQAV